MSCRWQTYPILHRRASIVGARPGSVVSPDMQKRLVATNRSYVLTPVESTIAPERATVAVASSQDMLAVFGRAHAIEVVASAATRMERPSLDIDRLHSEIVRCRLAACMRVSSY